METDRYRALQKEEVVIGICSPTDLDYIVNIFGLIRLGYTVFQLSPRLSPSAVKELLAKIQNGRPALLHAPAHTSFKLDALSNLELHPLVQRDEYDNSRHSETPEFILQGVDYEKEHFRRCLILHSSGSTGLPKPIDYSHRKLLAAGVYAQDATAFISMPFAGTFWSYRVYSGWYRERVDRHDGLSSRGFMVRFDLLFFHHWKIDCIQ